MSNYLQIAASQPVQKAKFENGSKLPIELWALCDEGKDQTSLVGLVFHPQTGQIVRADKLPGFQAYHCDRPRSVVGRLRKVPYPQYSEKSPTPRAATRFGNKSAQTGRNGQKLAKKPSLSKLTQAAISAGVQL